ncbi:MAG: hypothetical protein KTR31_35605 [Myxococcales bacterium]|nr:hypothetical protein [Myxococcales bacterium]
MHTYRWDLDRTYLETEIHSMRGLVRAAMEQASSKRTVPGAGALIRGLLAADPEAQLFVLSGSPQQMRSVLEEKLALDGVRVDRFILKDNLGNLTRGRLRAVRGQVGYKLPHLLADRANATRVATETLFGDDSETDAVIYAVYASVVAGALSADDVGRFLERGGAYPDAIEQSLASMATLENTPAPSVEDIFIRVDRGLPMRLFKLLGPLVKPVFSWWQAAAVLALRERLTPNALGHVTRACGLLDRPHDLAGLVQDAARRALAPPDALAELMRLEVLAPVGEVALRAIDQLGPSTPPVAQPSVPDYLAFLDGLEAL